MTDSNKRSVTMLFLRRFDTWFFSSIGNRCEDKVFDFARFSVEKLKLKTKFISEINVNSPKICYFNVSVFDADQFIFEILWMWINDNFQNFQLKGTNQQRGFQIDKSWAAGLWIVWIFLKLSLKIFACFGCVISYCCNLTFQIKI